MSYILKFLLKCDYVETTTSSKKAISLKKEFSDGYAIMVWVSKYSKTYDITIISGISTMIKVRKGSFKTYKETLGFIKTVL